MDPDDAEGSTAEECNDDLTPDHDTVDPDEEPVPVQTSQDIEFVVQPAVVELVEDLHPDEGVEDDRAADILWIVEEFLPRAEVQDQGYGELEDGLSDYHLPHRGGDQRGAAFDGLAVEDFFGWRVGGQCKGCEGVPGRVSM